MAAKIKQIIAREILDSRGWPTIEVSITLDNNLEASASSPSGVNAFNFEAAEKRDNDQSRYFGQGVLLAIKNINDIIAPALIGLSPLKQSEIDQKMIALDGSHYKEKLGANAILAVSLAVAKVAAMSKKQSLAEYLNESFFEATEMSLPSPILTMFNGGYYADTNLDFQEYLVVLNKKAEKFKNSKKSFSEMLRAGAEIYHSLGVVLSRAGYDTDTGSEGGYAPDMDSSIQALELIMASIIDAGYDSEVEVGLGVDIGAGTLYDEIQKQYIFSLDNNHFSGANLVGLYNEWLNRFPIVYLEDPVAPEDFESWKQISGELSNKLILTGDDFFSSNTTRLRSALKDHLANAVVIIPSQVGTLTETVECLKLARKHNYQIIISQRRGETNDDFIADLAVASGADYFKGGAPIRGERVAKWNRLLLLEDKLYGRKK